MYAGVKARHLGGYRNNDIMDHSVGSVDNDADEAVATAVEKTLSATMGAKRTINQSQSTKSRRKQKPSELQTCLQTVKEAVRNMALNNTVGRDCIEIIGFPERAQGRTEDTSRMVIDMCEKIGVDVASNDISTSLRIPGQAKAIVCKLVRREVKSNIMRVKKMPLDRR